MRHLAATMACLLLLPAAAQAQPRELMDLYTHLHTHPELSFHEADTAATLASELEALGFAVTTQVGGHGLVGVLENGEGPTVLLRTDLDALPVKEQTGKAYASTVTATDDAGNTVPVMHACGHDVHMTVFVGTARQLVEQRDRWAGTLVMIGQPAEERGAGARAMLADGLFERFPRPDYNLALHGSAALPAGSIGYTEGYALASVDSVDIKVFGVGGHGAYPHTTKDPVVLSAQIINALQTLVARVIPPVEPGVVTVGSIHGGTKHNIIPDEVQLQLTVRAYSEKTRNTLIEGIRQVARGQAVAAGLPEDKLPEVTVQDEHTRSTYNDPALVQRVVAVLETSLGAEQVQSVPAVMGGEDFSEYGLTDPKIPSFIYWLGGVEPRTWQAAQSSGESLPSLHSPFFAPDAPLAIETGVQAMTAAALDLLAAAPEPEPAPEPMAAPEAAAESAPEPEIDTAVE